MKNNKGFTLVEILAVIVLISLMMVIIVPSIQKVALNSKIKLCNSKITLVEESINLWARDNYKCFEKTNGCNILSNCQKNNDIIKCESTFKTLAENKLLNYDKSVKNINYVINPINNGNMNDTKIYVEFNSKNKQVKSYIDDTVLDKVCSKNANEVNPTVIEEIKTTSTTTVTKNTAVNFLENLYNKDASSNGLEIDNTTDKNLRYVGASPKNYIKFNNETWRIIGIFNVYNVDTNKTEKLVKIIRNESLGYYSWDATGNNDYGINDWAEADLMKELNGDYLDTTLTANKTNWYNSYFVTDAPVFRQTGVFDYTKVIKTKYQQMISTSIWNLGGNTYNDPITPPYVLSTKVQYEAERGTVTYQNSRATTWTGKIGLMYASDYGYASTDTECRTNLRAGYTYTNNTWDYTKPKCKNNNWLFNNEHQWTLSPYSSQESWVFGVWADGGVSNEASNNNLGVRPTLYLKSDVVISGGTGEMENPYTIE